MGAAVQAAAALSKSAVKCGDFVPGTAPAGFPSHSNAPVFSTADGQNLTQLGAILAHVAGGASATDAEWIGFAENVITPSASAWVFPTLGAMPNNKNAVAASLSLAFKQVLAPEYRKNVPHVTRWFQTCVHKMSAFGAHKLCEKEAQFDSKTFGALNKKDGKQAGKAKKEQPKKQEKAKPKAEPKPVEKKPEKPKDP